MKLPVIPTTGPVNNSGQCWCCPETNSIEEHHIIPQSYGGVNGPTAYVCAVCHGAVHDIATALYSDTMPPDREIIQALKRDLVKANICLTNVFILVKMILAARLAVLDDPNKSVVFMDRFPSATRRQLKDLRRVYPKLSQQKIVRLAIEQLHKKHLL